MSVESDVSRVEELLHTAVDSFGGTRRDGQVEMARRVADALESGTHLLVQAGTGTGKSLAYLIPAVSHALTENRPVLLSTATLALQAQIMGRDLPRLLEAIEPKLDRKVKVALVKGRANYLCKQKIAGGFPEEENDSEALFALGNEPTGGNAGTSALGKQVLRLREWAEETDTGDRDDLPEGVTDQAWRQVSVNAVDCLGKKCPMVEECFAELSRAEARESDVVVTNHAMLAIDAFEGLDILPEHDAVIVDEAHELAERVTSAVTEQLSAQMVAAAASSARRHTAIEVTALQDAGKGIEAAFAATESGLLMQTTNRPTGLNAQQTTAVEATRSAARNALREVKEGGDSDADAGRNTARARLQAVFDVCDRMLLAQDSPDVIWLTRPGSFVPGKGYTEADITEPPVLYVAPTTVASRLRDGLFGTRTVVLTSATLTIGESFDPVAGSLGLLSEQAPEWEATDVGTPFNYPQQGVLYVAKHLPPPSFQTQHVQREELKELIEASSGAALALFSSRRAAEEAAQELRKDLDVPILCQGDSTMSVLVRQFIEEEDTCLFGTMSLWQGVDVPGSACRLVAIDRIPFPRPDDPLMTARTREVERAGGNGFMSVAATHAAVRLAQGSGRLIRTAQDRGVLAILDSRLATKRYGGFLRKSMPDFWATTNPEIARGALRRLKETAGQ